MNLRRAIVCVLVLSGYAAAMPARAAELFPLSKAAPADVYICTAWRHNPEREFLDKAWGEVFAAFHKSGVVEEVWKLVTEADESEDHAETKALAEKMTKLFRGVDWCGMLGREGVIFGRMGFPAPDYVLMSRGTKESVAKNYAGLSALLAELKKRAGDEITIDEREIGGATVRTLGINGAPISFNVGYTQDVLFLSMGEKLMRESLRLLKGETTTVALVNTPRFKKAFEGLEPAEDSIVFFDGANLFASLRKMLDSVGAEMKKHEPADAEHEGQRPAAWLDMARALIDDMAVIDYVATTTHTDGMRVFNDTRTMMTADAKKCGAYPLFAERRSIDPFEKYIPTDAVSFEVSQGVNLRAAYQWGRAFVTTKVPKGKEMLDEHFDPMLEKIGLNVERDILSWIGGPSITVEMKSSNPMMGSEVAWMKKVTDEDVARKKVRAGIDTIGEKLGELMSGGMGGMGGGMRPRAKQGGNGEAPMISSKPISIAGKKGFYEIRVQHPMLMMMMAQFAPVWGVCDGYLWVGSSKSAVAHCMETASGERENIRKNKRFAAEAILPSKGEGTLTAVSFTDQSMTAENLQQALGAVGMALGMATQFNPAINDMPQPAAKIFKAVPGIMMKLGPVAGKLNFFQSTSSCETFDGHATRVRTVQNYRKPPVQKQTDEDDDSWGDEEKPATKQGEKAKGPKAEKPNKED